MLPSDVYYKRAKQVLKNSTGKDEDQLAAEIRDVLFDSMRDIPTNLQHDIFNFYYDKYLDLEDPNKTLYTLCEMPVPMIDFLMGNILTDDLKFSDEEWDLIREGINAVADEMDMTMLTRLMTILVDKKKY